MRIISGFFKSRKISIPPGTSIRPTADKVKGAIFNIIGSITDFSVLDLYAGSGNLGLEALSRGAKTVTWVDHSFKSISTIKANIKALAPTTVIPNCELNIVLNTVERSFEFFFKKKIIFDLILADPPYNQGALKSIQKLLIQSPILNNNGILIIEHGAKDTEQIEEFQKALLRQNRYGQTIVSIFKNPSV
jgi:16S rRNA (guanine(966)-N(2))-methyltransferase RsmD